MADHVLHSIRDSDLTLRELMDFTRSMQAAHPEWEVFLDGDLYAIVGRDRA